MENACDLIIKDPTHGRTFLRALESICVQSDTVLFKVKKQGVFVLLTDPDALCAAETRLNVSQEVQLKLFRADFSAKVMLESLINHIKTLLHSKRPIHMCGTADHKLYIEDGGRRVILDSAEHRPRTFFVLSTRKFQSQPVYAKFRIASSEFNRIITSHAIIAGTSGGVTTFQIGPGSEPLSVVIRMTTPSNSCARAVTTIYTSTTTKDVPVDVVPAEQVEARVLLTFLKRSQSIIASSLDHMTVYISKQGLLLQTRQKHSVETLVFIADVSDVDLGSFGGLPSI